MVGGEYEYQSDLCRATVTLSGNTKYFTATTLDDDHSYYESNYGFMYADDEYFYDQWGMNIGGTRYGVIYQTEMDAFEDYKMALLRIHI